MYSNSTQNTAHGTQCKFAQCTNVTYVLAIIISDKETSCGAVSDEDEDLLVLVRVHSVSASGLSTSQANTQHKAKRHYNGSRYLCLPVCLLAFE